MLRREDSDSESEDFEDDSQDEDQNEELKMIQEMKTFVKLTPELMSKYACDQDSEEEELADEHLPLQRAVT